MDDAPSHIKAKAQRAKMLFDEDSERRNPKIDSIKICIYQLVLCLITARAVAQESVPRTPEPQWKVSIRVLDESGLPLGRVSVTIGYYVKPKGKESVALDSKRGETDTNGWFVATGQSRSSDLLIGAVKDGYYKTQTSYELGPAYAFDPIKWSPTLTLVLKQHRHPVPMYAKRVRREPPVLDKPVGYDLAVGDWVAPHGAGARTDILFTKSASLKAANDYDAKLTVTFPNPGDGIQPFDVPDRLGEGSALRSPHQAPQNGYLSTLIRETSAHPDQPPKFDFDENRNYFLRVRTTLDEKGNVKSALYGKIYGDFMQFVYYLNPTPNDRNIEFDPKQNLTKNLQPPEQVDAP